MRMRVITRTSEYNLNISPGRIRVLKVSQRKESAVNAGTLIEGDQVILGRNLSVFKDGKIILVTSEVLDYY